MRYSPRSRAGASIVLAGALTLSGLFGFADTASAQERSREPIVRHSEPTAFVMVEAEPDRLGFAVESTKDTGGQQFCDGTPVPDDIVECDIDEIAWTCVNGDTDPTDGGCIGNADKPSVFPQD